MWRGGCIIRSIFLGKIKEAFDKNPDLENLLLDPYFADKVQTGTGVVAASGGVGGRHGRPGARAVERARLL